MHLLCLHGWGGSSESFTELRAALRDARATCTLHTPDLPGFGDEPEPLHPWTTDDYVEWVEVYIKQYIGSEPFTLLGHSHGGRIAIKLAARHTEGTAYTTTPVHLFLCAPAGIRHSRHFKRILGLTLAKSGKLLLSIPGLRGLQSLGKRLLYKLVRVHDYEKASQLMQQTLINVSREDLRPLLSSITVPTDLFWGTADGMTPYSDALLMRREIAGSTLHTFKGVHHRVHRDRAGEISKVILQKTHS